MFANISVTVFFSRNYVVSLTLFFMFHSFISKWFESSLIVWGSKNVEKDCSKNVQQDSWNFIILDTLYDMDYFYI